MLNLEQPSYSRIDLSSGTLSGHCFGLQVSVDSDLLYALAAKS